MAEPSVPSPVAGAPVADAPRVLLVDPYVAREDPMERKFVELYPSLGILTLAGWLREHGIRTEVTDLTFARDAEPVTRHLRRFRPHVVGVHTKTLTMPRALEIAVRARAEGALPVAGGPDAATRPDRYLDEGFAAVVPSEGEATLVEVATRVRDGVPLAGCAGVLTRSGGRTARGPPRPFLRNLDELPLPAWDLVDMEGYLSAWEHRTGERRAAVLTSRGCPFDCSWCSKPTFGRTYRQQSVDRVLDELRALQDLFRVDYVRFCDDVFGVDRRWLETLLERMLIEGPHLQFECLARVDLLKADLLDTMKSAGLQRVYLGVESGSQKMLDVMNRGTRLAQIQRVAESLRAHQVRQFWFLMLGYPGETLEDIDATLDLFRRFSPEEYSVSIAVPVPGTRFYDSVKDRLRGRARTTRGSGGVSLLYEAAYPESLYRWQQVRFGWEARLARIRERFSPEVAERLSRAADEIHERIAKPLLLGRSPAVSRPGASRESGALPMVVDPPATQGPSA
ncbi:MAG: B12-binding domain-containing radical SAM protein [Thermoplasmata archaeon]|nr:B12-binding domain-containing radical SAM protein [Thermoplasmata archaeon]